MSRSYQRIKGDPERTIVVGDIHGCYDEFAKLLAEIVFSDDDLLLAVGDLVDRGPATWDVVRFFHETPNAHSVLGNHERRLAGTVLGTSQPAWSQRHSLSRLPEDEHDFWARWLGSLPAIIETDDVIVTHARIDPAVALDDQDPFHTCAVGGHRVVFEKNDDDVPLWHAGFRQCQEAKPICMGHASYSRRDLRS